MPSSKDPVINRQKANEWRLKNLDKHREDNRRWMAAKRQRLGRHARAIEGRRAKERDPLGHLLRIAEKRARDQNIPFAITREDVTMPDKCPVFGTAWEWGVGKMGWRNRYAPSLDKVKPRLGYVPGNVRVISTRANHLKNNASVSEIRAVLAYMEREGCDETFVEADAYLPGILESDPQLQLGI
jgi:hypothetical protein